MLVQDFLLRARDLFSGQLAVVDGDARLTYAQLDDRVRRLAAALQRLGVKPGETIACLSHNTFRYMEVFLGAAVAGVVLAPINTRLAPPETEFILNDGGARVLLLQSAFLPVLDAIGARLTSVQHVVLLDGPSRDNAFAYETLLEQADPLAIRHRDWNEEDLALLCYTGGTTGLPKGVMLSQRNLVANARNAIQMMELNERDVWLHIAPMFHLADAWACYALTALGATHVFQERFQPRAMLENIQQHGITASSVVPTIINALLEVPDAGAFRLQSLRRMIYGASPMPVERLRSAVKLFGPVLQQCYGQTESSPFLTTTSLKRTLFDSSEHGTRRLASCGQPLLGVDLKLVSPRGEPVREGEVGEILARGPNIMLGYWNRPKESAAALEGGWLHTGDLATWDSDRWVFIVDRAKDVIISGGENVFSTEVEAALYKHPAVLEAAVIGVPDERWGESVKAMVVLREGQALSTEALITHCQQWIAKYKCPKTVDFLPALPKSGAGKILKSELRKPYWPDAQRRVH